MNKIDTSNWYLIAEILRARGLEFWAAADSYHKPGDGIYVCVEVNFINPVQAFKASELLNDLDGDLVFNYEDMGDTDATLWLHIEPPVHMYDPKQVAIACRAYLEDAQKWLDRPNIVSEDIMNVLALLEKLDEPAEGANIGDFDGDGVPDYEPDAYEPDVDDGLDNTFGNIYPNEDDPGYFFPA